MYIQSIHLKHTETVLTGRSPTTAQRSIQNSLHMRIEPITSEARTNSQHPQQDRSLHKFTACGNEIRNLLL